MSAARRLLAASSGPGALEQPIVSANDYLCRPRARLNRKRALAVDLLALDELGRAVVKDRCPEPLRSLDVGANRALSGGALAALPSLWDDINALPEHMHKRAVLSCPVSGAGFVDGAALERYVVDTARSKPILQEVLSHDLDRASRLCLRAAALTVKEGGQVLYLDCNNRVRSHALQDVVFDLFDCRNTRIVDVPAEANQAMAKCLTKTAIVKCYGERDVLDALRSFTRAMAMAATMAGAGTEVAPALVVVDSLYDLLSPLALTDSGGRCGGSRNGRGAALTQAATPSMELLAKTLVVELKSVAERYGTGVLVSNLASPAPAIATVKRGPCRIYPLQGLDAVFSERFYFPPSPSPTSSSSVEIPLQLVPK
jgi:hypothetical protein